MNKNEFIKYISEQKGLKQTESKNVVEIFTECLTKALKEGKEIGLIGFGSFTVSKVEARAGRNPRTGEAIQIASYKQPKFKVGQTLKNAVNNN